MIKDALQHILGLDDKTSEIVERLLIKLNKTQDVEQHLMNLSDDVMTALKQMDGVIDHPDDPDNSDFSQYYDKHETDGWAPEEDDARSEIDQKLLPKVAKDEDYMSEKQSFLSYMASQHLQERTKAQVDNDLINMSDELDDDIDPATKKRIDAYKKQGNEEAADRLRTRALRKGNMQNKKPKSPTQSLVDAKKKQLSQALRANARHTDEEK